MANDKHEKANREWRSPSSLVGYLQSVGGGTNDVHVTFIGLDGNLLARAVEVVSLNGGFIQLGRTKKGTAFSIRVWIDGDALNYYPNSLPGLEEVLTTIAAFGFGEQLRLDGDGQAPVGARSR